MPCLRWNISTEFLRTAAIFFQGENPVVYAVIRNQRFLIARQTQSGERA